MKLSDPIIKKAVEALERGDMVVYKTDGCKMYAQRVESGNTHRYTITCDEESGAEPCKPDCNHDDPPLRSEYISAIGAMNQDLDIIDDGTLRIRRRTPVDGQLSDEEVIDILNRLGADLGIIVDAQMNGFPLHLWLLEQLEN